MSYEKIIKDIQKRKIPLQAMQIVTWRCNLRCEYCYPFLPKEDDISLAEIKAKIDEIAEEGNLQITINGGEPLLRDDFLEIVEYASKKPLAVTICTNGILMTPEIVASLKDLNVIQVKLNILAACADIHDEITGVEGSFDKMLAASGMLKEKGVNVLFETVLIKQNEDQIEPLEKLSEDVDIPLRFKEVDYPDEDVTSVSRDAYIEKYRVNKPKDFYWR